MIYEDDGTLDKIGLRPATLSVLRNAGFKSVRDFEGMSDIDILRRANVKLRDVQKILQALSH